MANIRRSNIKNRMGSDFNRYISEVLSAKNLSNMHAEDWNQFEACLGKIYLAILQPFIHDSHIQNRDYLGLNIPDYKIENKNNGDICLGAVNFRGLYQRNGRETLLEPCGSYLPKMQDEWRHNYIHKSYIRLVRKAVSINQLFLINTDLDSLFVKFIKRKNGSNIESTNKHSIITITEDMLEDFPSQQIILFWESIFRKATTLNKIRDSVEIDFPPAAEDNFEGKALEVIKNNPYIVRELFSMPLKTPPRNCSIAGFHMEEWLRSIYWLRFYCRKEHAGAYFYTIRLPKLIPNHDIFPDSSLSLVSQVEIEKPTIDTFKELKNILSKNKSYLQFMETAEKKYEEFLNKRKGATKTGDPNKSLAQVVNGISESEKKSVLPVDFSKLVFLLKTARMLIGQKHEGEMLKFCFIMGFSKELVDAESHGIVDESTIDLRNRWNRFNQTFLKHNPNPEAVANGMSRWIKSNDLQLQPFDTAIYFDEKAGNDYPVPTGIIHLKHEFQGKILPVSTLFQLHSALRRLTSGSSSTVGVVTTKGGLIAYISGHSILIPCSSRDKFTKDIEPDLCDDKPLESVIREYINKTLTDTFTTYRDPKVYNNISKILDKLIETLVILNHGALIVVRNSTEENRDKLTPLNPVWCIRNSIPMNNIEEIDYVTLALMAALDGATEVVLPKHKRKELVFSCRKFVHSLRPIWKAIDGEPSISAHAVLLKDIKQSPLSLIGKGTRHHSALALSCQLGKKALVITVSADGPVTFWRDGLVVPTPEDIELRYAP